MTEEDINIKIPYDLAGKLSKRVSEGGFNSLTEYIIYILGQVISQEEDNNQSDDEEEKNVRERLKDLGYL